MFVVFFRCFNCTYFWVIEDVQWPLMVTGWMTLNSFQTIWNGLGKAEGIGYKYSTHLYQSGHLKLARNSLFNPNIHFKFNGPKGQNVWYQMGSICNAIKDVGWFRPLNELIFGLTVCINKQFDFIFLMPRDQIRSYIYICIYLYIK